MQGKLLEQGSKSLDLDTILWTSLLDIQQEEVEDAIEHVDLEVWAGDIIVGSRTI